MLLERLKLSAWAIMTGPGAHLRAPGGVLFLVLAPKTVCPVTATLKTFLLHDMLVVVLHWQIYLLDLFYSSNLIMFKKTSCMGDRQYQCPPVCACIMAISLPRVVRAYHGSVRAHAFQTPAMSKTVKTMSKICLFFYDFYYSASCKNQQPPPP